MRNIPIFTTEFGAASLILKEIPYTKTAFIQIQSSFMPEELLRECVDFCRVVGAEKIYATGDPYLEKFPLYTQVVCMYVLKNDLEKTEAAAVSVTDETASLWQEIYNRRMRDVDNAAYMCDSDVRQMQKDKDGYFIYDQHTLIGIGRASGNQIRAIASEVPGRGKDTLLALADVLQEERIFLEVASTNSRAIRLYKALGFGEKTVLFQWYKII